MTTVDPRQVNKISKFIDGVECITQPPADNSNNLASTEYVDDAVSGVGLPDLTWTPADKKVTPSAGTGVAATLTDSDGVNSGLMSSAQYTKLLNIIDTYKNIGSISDEPATLTGIADENVLAYATDKFVNVTAQSLLAKEPLYPDAVSFVFPIIAADLLRYLVLYTVVAGDTTIVPTVGLPQGFECYITRRTGEVVTVTTGIGEVIVSESGLYNIKFNGTATLYKEETNVWNLSGDLE